MAFSIFGFSIKRREEENSSVNTFVAPTITDDIGEAKLVGASPHYSNIALDNTTQTSEVSENALIMQYRDISRYSEVDKAIEEIVSEAIIVDEIEPSIKLDLTKVQVSEAIKEKIRKSFDKTLKLLDFSDKGFDIFRRFYIDGRINYHIIIDEKNLKRGVVELRYIDPKKIKKIREILPSKDGERKVIEYYKFNEHGVDNKTNEQGVGFNISVDSIAHTNSGITNSTNTTIISYLDKAINHANKLRTLENSMVLYRLVRAPQRRLIYVDTQNQPRARAEQYLQSFVARYKTKITYDTVTGKIKDDRNIMALTEDYFIPRSNGSTATEFKILEGGTTSPGTVEEIEYQKKQLLESLNVPLSRLDSNSVFNIGRSGEISREEARFIKFVARLRTKFNKLFSDILGKDLVITNVMSIEDWDDIKGDIRFDYLKDNYLVEILEADALANRLSVLAQIEPYVGTYYSHEYVKKYILKQTDEDIVNIAKQIEKEKKENPDAHIPVDSQHQFDLQTKLSGIPSGSSEFPDDHETPNPFKKGEE